MKTTVKPVKPTTNHLGDWLAHPGLAKYLGPTAMFRLEILAQAINGTPSLASIARAHGVSRQAAHAQAKDARAAFAL